MRSIAATAAVACTPPEGARTVPVQDLEAEGQPLDPHELTLDPQEMACARDLDPQERQLDPGKYFL